MASLKKYNMQGDAVGEVEIADSHFEGEAHPQMIKDYLVAIRKNRRQWSANTKGRSEIAHSNKKPHPQKGTGRARQGTLAAPQYKGGGVVFGPKPKFDMHTRINQKERRSVIRHLIAEMVKEGTVHVLQYEQMEAPRTKDIAGLLKKMGIESDRVMFLTEGAKGESISYANFMKSMRNLQKKQFKPMPALNGYDVALNKHLVVMEGAMEDFEACLDVRKIS